MARWADGGEDPPHSVNRDRRIDHGPEGEDFYFISFLIIDFFLFIYYFFLFDRTAS